MSLQEKTISVSGLPVHFWQDGEQNARVILLLHSGFSDAYTSWGGVIPPLADGFRVIAPDLPGYGKTAPLPDMQITTVIAWIKALLDELEIQEAVVVGNSFGGMFARLFAAAYPQYVPALILVNGGTLPNIPGFIASLGKVPVIGAILFGIIARSATSPEALSRMIFVKEALTENLSKVAAANTTNFARLLQMTATHSLPQKHLPPVPTLLLWGVDDQEYPLAEAKRIQAQIAGAKLNEIESCGHMPQLETPDVFTWQVKHFLDELTRPRKPSASSGAAGPLPDLPQSE